MRWQPKQISVAAHACRAGKIADHHRRLLLQQLGGRAMVEGVPSSKSSRLTQADYNVFMSNVERCSGGQIKIMKGGTFKYARGEWEKKEGDNLRKQLAHIAGEIIGELRLSDVPENIPGVIGKAIGRKFTELDDIEKLTESEIRKVVHALRAVADRHSVALIKGGAA